MKFKTTIILFAIFLVIMAFVLFFESKGKGEKEEEGKLVALTSDDVQKIILKRKDEILTFQKDDNDEWLITEPLEAKADKYEVNRLVSDFSDLKIERVVEEEPQDLEKYEFPQKEISLWFKDKEEPVKILIGIENPLDNTFFAKREDEKKVVLIPSHLKSLMEKTLFDFREKNIFQFEAEDVKSIKLQAKKIHWETKKEEEEWFLTKPVKALARATEIDSILASLSNLKAKEFISEEKKKDETKNFGLNQPEYKIILSMPLKNQEVIFFLNKKEDKLYATTSLSSKIVLTEDALLSDLEKEPEELREKEVANFYTWEVNKLHLKKGELDLTLVKDEEDNWHIESQEEEELQKDKIQTFIRKIESLEAVEFIDPPLNLKDYGLDNPQAEVKIWQKKNEEKFKEIKILIGLEDKGAKQVAVKNARFDYFFKVDSAFLEEFPKEIIDWKKEEEKE